MGDKPDLNLTETDDFYIGYLPAPPAAHTRLVRRVLALLAFVLIIALSLLATSQQKDMGGHFEYGKLREFRGVLYTEPVPMLQLTETAGGLPPAGTTLLVGAWKYGIPDNARQAHGQAVRFTGTLIYRDSLTMIEITEPASFQVTGEAALPASPESRWLQSVTLTGELVDSKCYLGVMRPGFGKVHRGCAVRCLSGGVPPAILLRGQNGQTQVFMLAGADGGPLQYDVELAARQITVAGTLWLAGGTPVVRVQSLKVHDD